MNRMTSRKLVVRARRSGHCGKGFTLLEIMIVVFILALLANIAAPAFIYARDNSWQKSCCQNLTHISLAKEQFAIDNGIGDNFNIVWSNLSEYINSDSTEPVCPATGQTYSINTIDVLPTCPYGGPSGLPHVIY